MTHEIDNFQAAADALGGIEGLHLRCSKGKWMADDIPLVTGPDGAKIVVIVPTMATGRIRWVDSKPSEKHLGRIIDGFIERPELPDDSWNVYSECSCVFVDDAHRGAPATFTSSSWGGYFALTKLLRPYVRVRTYPICTLATKPRGDINGNIDPIFNMTGWANPDDFPGYAPAPQLGSPTTPKLAYANRRDEPSSAKIINDDIPFAWVAALLVPFAAVVISQVL